MTKYLLLFRDGIQIPDDEKIKAWDTYIGRLAREGKFVSGLPFGPNAKVVSGPEKTVGEFSQIQGAITGYIMIRANSLDEALELAKLAPNLESCGSVEIRSTIPPVQ
jgi:hypothetical protein